MRERWLGLELHPLDWYEEIGEPPRPLRGEEGERLFRREAARVRRHGGALTVMSLRIVTPEVPRAQTLADIGELLARSVRDCDFVTEGEEDELLVGLPGADSAAARSCLSRLACRIMELPPVQRARVMTGVAELGDNESIDDTVSRARRERQRQPVMHE